MASVNRFLCKKKLVIPAFIISSVIWNISSTLSAFLFQKFFMVASFRDLTLFQYHDCIGVSDRRESVGNDKYRSALHDSITATRANAHL